MTTDKPLPRNDEAERSVVGSLLIDSTLADRVSGWLEQRHFYDRQCGLVYQTILDMVESRRTVDLVTVKDELRSTGKMDTTDAGVYISGLVDGIPDIANIVGYARIVKRDSDRRDGIRACADAMESFWHDSDVGSSANKLLDVASDLIEDDDDGSGPLDNRALAIQGIAAIDRRVSGHVEANAVPTGFMGLDAHMEGFTRGCTTIVAGRTGEGKTTWTLNAAINAAEAGYHSIFFSLDMSRSMVRDRLLSMVSGIDASFVKRGRAAASGLYAGMSVEEMLHRVTMGAQRMSNWRGSLTVDDRAYDVSEILATCRTAVRANKLDMIIIDYVQAVESSAVRADERLRLQHVVNRLNAFGKAHNVAIVLLSQYNKNVHFMDRPHRGLLAESSAMERTARNVILIWRPGMSKSSDDLPCRSVAIVDKASEYGERDIEMHFNAACFLFEEKYHDSDCYYWRDEGAV